MTSSTYSYSSDWVKEMDWYPFCRSAATDAGEYLRARYKGLSMLQVMDAQREAISKRIANGPSPKKGTKEDLLNIVFNGSRREIIAAFQQPFPQSDAAQEQAIMNFKDEWLMKCLQETSK